MEAENLPEGLPFVAPRDRSSPNPLSQARKLYVCKNFASFYFVCRFVMLKKKKNWYAI